MDPTWQEKLRYRFDNYMSRGTVALIGGLAILSLVLIFFMAAVISLTGISSPGSDPLNFPEAAWQSLMRTLDAGTMGGDEGWGFRLLMFLVTLGGVFVISTLIGVLTSGIEGKMEDLRKGRSRVIEKDHTIILGWSPMIFTIVSELVTANANKAYSSLVILGDKDKVEMEDEMHAFIPDTKTTHIVFRTGNPIDMADLELVSLNNCRSVIILSPESGDPDAHTIKTILAITNNPRRRPEPYHIVAEIVDQKNIEVARMVGKDEVELILTGNLVSRIIAQTCRQSGLSVVYTELLDYGGDEIYFREEPGFTGKAFKDILMDYRKSTVMGLWNPATGVRLNPPMDTLVQPGDQVIVISQDDDTITFEPPETDGIQTDCILDEATQPYAPERILILGWNQRAPSIINELEAYVTMGSQVSVIADYEDGKAHLARLCPDLKHIQLTYQVDDTTDRRVLEGISPHTYHYVIVLSYSDTRGIQDADACTLMTLLHLRDMQEKSGQDFAIVSEMQDVQNRALAEVTQADDFIVSDRIISLILTQVSENKRLNAVFTDIFDPDGSEIYLKQAGHYVKMGEPVNFYTVVAAAARRGEVAIGYRLKKYAGQAEKSYGVRVNPDKSEKIAYGPGDRFIVLAEG